MVPGLSELSSHRQILSPDPSCGVSLELSGGLSQEEGGSKIGFFVGLVKVNQGPFFTVSLVS